MNLAQIMVSKYCILCQVSFVMIDAWKLRPNKKGSQLLPDRVEEDKMFCHHETRTVPTVLPAISNTLRMKLKTEEHTSLKY